MSFDIDHYAQTSTRIRWDDLDMSTFETQPLSNDALRCLSYMSDVETHTVCYLRDLLVTPSHADPEVTVFLTMWNLEEYWHGEVLDEVLERHGVPTGPEHTRAVRSRLGWRDRLAPIRQSLLANIIGEDFVATHMAWGAINEWCAHSAYTRLIQAERHPVLTEILKRIAKQETRHVAFYNSQARDRLLRSKKAQKIARFALLKGLGNRRLDNHAARRSQTHARLPVRRRAGPGRSPQGRRQDRRPPRPARPPPGRKGTHQVRRNPQLPTGRATSRTRVRGR